MRSLILAIASSTMCLSNSMSEPLAVRANLLKATITASEDPEVRIVRLEFRLHVSNSTESVLHVNATPFLLAIDQQSEGVWRPVIRSDSFSFGKEPGHNQCKPLRLGHQMQIDRAVVSFPVLVSQLNKSADAYRITMRSVCTVWKTARYFDVVFDYKGKDGRAESLLELTTSGRSDESVRAVASPVKE